MKPGDLVLMRGTSELALEIMKATGGRFSHVAVVVCSMAPSAPGDGIVIEAVMPRVVTRPFHDSILGVDYWEIWSNKTLADYRRGESSGGVFIQRGRLRLRQKRRAGTHSCLTPNFILKQCRRWGARSLMSLRTKSGCGSGRKARDHRPSRAAPSIGIAEFVAGNADK